MICAKSMADIGPKASPSAHIDLSEYEVVSRGAFQPSRYPMTFDYRGNGSVTIGGACLDAMGNPEYIMTLINTEDKKLLLAERVKTGGRNHMPEGAKVARDEEGAFTFKGCSLFFAKLSELLDIDYSEYGTALFLGKPVEGNKMMFDLTKGVMRNPDDLADGAYNNRATGSSATLKVESNPN